jgi:hypothetical protein
MTTSVVPKHWCDRLEAVGACDEAVAWARTQPSPEAAWQNCDRGDWMLWIVGRVAGGEIGSPERRRLVLAACDCAELSLLAFESEYPNDGRPRNAIETARRYALGDGSATLSAVNFVTRDYAAYAANTAAHTAANAANAAYTAAYAAHTAAYASTGNPAAPKQCADIVRKHYPHPPELP